MLHETACTMSTKKREASVFFDEDEREQSPRILYSSSPEPLSPKQMEINALVKRIREIEAELHEMGAVRENGRPVPPRNCLDKSWFRIQLPLWKRDRALGKDLDHHAFVPLKHYKMVDGASLQARLDALYREECDTLIRLREFQLEGVEVDFDFSPDDSPAHSRR